MSKPVKSTDFRKSTIMTHLKEVSGGSKITNVRELKDGSFTGSCFKHVGNRKYEFLGTFTVTIDGDLLGAKNEVTNEDISPNVPVA